MKNGLRLVVKFLEKNNIKYCLAGGYAVVYYGVNRYTEDLDFFVAIDVYDCDKVLKNMQSELPITNFGLSTSLLKIFIDDLRIDIIPYYTPEEKRGLKNAKYRNVYGTKCKMIQLEDLLLLKLSIAGTEERHLNDVHHICNNCSDKIDIKYLKEGIRDLKMERFIPTLENLLNIKLK